MIFVLLIITVLTAGTLIEGLDVKILKIDNKNSIEIKYFILVFYIALTSFLLKDIELSYAVPHHILYLLLMIVVYKKRFNYFHKKNIFIFTCSLIFTVSLLLGYFYRSYLLYSTIPLLAVSLLFFITKKVVRP